MDIPYNTLREAEIVLTNLRSPNAAAPKPDESGDCEGKCHDSKPDQGHNRHLADEDIRYVCERRDVQYRLVHLQDLAEELD